MTAPVVVGVRPAGLDDIAALSEAHRLGQAAVVDSRGGPLDTLLRGRAEPVEDSFSADLDNDERLVLVGSGDNTFLGYCVLEFRALRSGELLAIVTDLWVHPEARGIGVGHALMRQATDAATQRECIGIDARALPGDRATKNFFESFGLVARAIEVHKALP